MNTTLTILTVVGTIGAIDVVYYHLCRFRLYSQPSSVGEEVTHLVRHVMFLAILLVCMQPSTPHVAAAAAALFAVDMSNSVVDVLLEKKSRAALGGLPSGEYLVHILSSFGLGLAVASYVQGIGSPAPEPQGLLLWQIRGMLLTGALLFVVEATLFARALRARRAGRPLATPTLAGAAA